MTKTRNNYVILVKREDGWIRIIAFESSHEIPDDLSADRKLRRKIYSKMMDISSPDKWAHLIDVWCNREKYGYKLLYQPQESRNNRWSLVDENGIVEKEQVAREYSTSNRAVELWRNGKKIGEFESLSKCAKHLGCSAGKLHYAIHKRGGVYEKVYRVKEIKSETKNK